MTDLYPWLEAARHRVAAAFAAQRLPHALMICGPAGLGKRVLADAIARHILCEFHTVSSGACGSCPACVTFAAGTHPDFTTVSIEEDASVIKIDQIRALGERLSLSSHQDGYKVAVLDPADKMNLNAQNSLLKTLEEPSDNTVLVLVCERPSQLQPTVRSRCQQLRLETPTRDDALHWLATQALPAPLEICLQMAQGAPLKAVQLAEAGSLDARREHFESLVGILEGRVTPLKIAETWAADKELQAVHWLREWLMDLLRISVTGETSSVRSQDLVESLATLASRMDCRVLFAQLDRVNRVLGQATAGLNRQLQTEDILLSWASQT